MASLTHVCMWSDNGWKRITAEQASRLHPGGTVSAHSGLFMCELCGQYVGLSNGKIYTPLHFSAVPAGQNTRKSPQNLTESRNLLLKQKNL